MTISHFDEAREMAIDAYIQALDSGDFEKITAILDQAASDHELDRLIHEINAAFYAEEGFDSFSVDAAQVRALVHQHLQSAFIDETELEAEFDRPLTVKEVIARLESDRQIPDTDRNAGKKLRECHTELPAELTTRSIMNLAQALGVTASERFWRAFRDTALMLNLGNSQAQARLAAAREQRTRHNPDQLQKGNNERKGKHNERTRHE